MALRHSLGAATKANLLERAVKQAVAEGAQPRDMAEPGKPVLPTSEMGDAVLRTLDRLKTCGS